MSNEFSLTDVFKMLFFGYYRWDSVLLIFWDYKYCLWHQSFIFNFNEHLIKLMKKNINKKKSIHLLSYN